MLERISIDNNGIVDNRYLYSEFLLRLKDYYDLQKLNSLNGAPELSFTNTKLLRASSIPNLLTIGELLSKYHKKPIKLYLGHTYGGVTDYIYHSSFFSIAEKLQIFDINEVCNIDNFIMRRIRVGMGCDYFLPKDDMSNVSYLYRLEEILLHRLLGAREILDALNLDEQYKSILLNVVAELVCNAIHHSGGVCFTYYQLMKQTRSAIITICDGGIGFEKSFKAKSEELKYADIICEYGEDFKDIIYIVQAIYHHDQDINFNVNSLMLIKKIVCDCDGVFRIHYNSSQISFERRCRGCLKRAIECMECLISNRNYQFTIFPVMLKGVHIEIEIPFK